MGNRNTAFFHKFASQRRLGNYIDNLEYEDGRKTNDEIEKEELARDFFTQLFSFHRCGNFNCLLSGIDCCVNHEDNLKLTSNFLEEEVWTTVKEMGGHKSPK